MFRIYSRDCNKAQKMATTFDLDMAPTTHSVYLGCHRILLVVYKKTKPTQLYPEIKHLKCVRNTHCDTDRWSKGSRQLIGVLFMRGMYLCRWPLGSLLTPTRIWNALADLAIEIKLNIHVYIKVYAIIFIYWCIYFFCNISWPLAVVLINLMIHLIF